MIIQKGCSAKATQLALRACGSIVTIFLDCDPEGEAGTKQALGYLAQLIPVRLSWTISGRPAFTES